jgi:hypothetical protein
VAVFHERLAYVSLQQQDWSGALHESSEAVRLNHFRRFARMFVVQCDLHRNDRNRATDEFSILIGLNPSLRGSFEEWFAKESSH